MYRIRIKRSRARSVKKGMVQRRGYYWRLEAANGRTLATSEIYVNKPTKVVRNLIHALAARKTRVDFIDES